MGSVTETIREVIDYENANGQKVGMIAVHLYRPFSAKYFMEAVPATVKRITVLDRTKEPGANGDPLYLDVRDIFYGQANAPVIVGGRYGMGSKDVTPSQIIAVYKNMERNEPKNQFTIGIEDDVTFRSLPAEADVKILLPELMKLNSMGWDLMVLLVLTRTQSRLSVELPINIVRPILLMILKNQVVLQLLTCVSGIVRFVPLI
ncbi:MAG: hypothetical protein V8S95_00735 [Odoribacter sp.]